MGSCMIGIDDTVYIRINRIVGLTFVSRSLLCINVTCFICARIR